MRWIVVMLLWSPAALVAAAPQQDPMLAPAHAHAHAEPAAAADQQEQRWIADAPLRQTMQQIRSARAHKLGSQAEAVVLAQVIDDAIGYMIRNCALPPDADAALHGVIGQLGGVAGALRRDDDPRAAIALLDAALARYAQLFDESAVPEDDQ